MVTPREFAFWPGDGLVEASSHHGVAAARGRVYRSTGEKHLSHLGDQEVSEGPAGIS